jgi:hypothetical protein
MELSHLASPEEAAAVERAARENYYDENAAPDSFWRMAAATLPPHIRRRYLPLFEAAERWDPVLELVVDAFRPENREIGKSRDREIGKHLGPRSLSSARPHGI